MGLGWGSGPPRVIIHASHHPKDICRQIYGMKIAILSFFSFETCIDMLRQVCARRNGREDNSFDTIPSALRLLSNFGHLGYILELSTSSSYQNDVDENDIWF